MCYPKQKGIYAIEQERMKYNQQLGQGTSKKVTYLPLRTEISLSDIRKCNKEFTTRKRKRRWENSNDHKHKQTVPKICRVEL